MNGLIAQMLQAAGVTQDWLWPAVLVFLRVGAAMALMPAFGEQVVPQRVRLMLAVAFTAVVLPPDVEYEVELSMKSATELNDETKASILLRMPEASAVTVRVSALVITASALSVRPAMP